MIAQTMKDRSYTETRLGPAVEDYLRWKLNEAGASPRTVSDYERTLARMALTVDKMLYEVTTEDLRRVRDTYPPGSRYTVTAHLKDFWKWLYQEERIDTDPALRIRYPKRTKEIKIEVFSDVECEALAGLREARDRALVLLLLHTGIRKSEARNLRVKNVNLERGLVTIVRGKGGKGRIAPIMSQRAVSALAELITLDGLQPDDYLWYSRTVTPRAVTIKRGKPIGDTSFQAWWVRCVEEAGIDYRKAHTTRHTFATRWMRDGGRIEFLKDALGHASISLTVDTYGHLTDDDMLTEVTRMREVDRLRTGGE